MIGLGAPSMRNQIKFTKRRQNLHIPITYLVGCTHIIQITVFFSFCGDTMDKPRRIGDIAFQ